MNNIVKIYGLYNPINNTPFYVGATIMDLKNRLVGHCGKHNYIENTYTISKKRSELIQSIKDKGLKPEIRLLKEVLSEKADYYEKYYYDLFTFQGYELLQSKNHFSYTKSKRKVISSNYYTPLDLS